MMKKQTQSELLLEYYEENPDRDIPHAEIVDWATEKWFERNGTVFRDPDRGIRKLHQEGFLKKVQKGVYRYSTNNLMQRIELQRMTNFTAQQKEEILKRDGYKCSVCGACRNEGVELHVDHIKPMYYGGEAKIENGQVLCGRHNYLKKNFEQTTLGKKLFINLYRLAKVNDDNTLINFCCEIRDLYEKYDIDGHIEWKE